MEVALAGWQSAFVAQLPSFTVLCTLALKNHFLLKKGGLKHVLHQNVHECASICTAQSS
jgi:hypothetical protein